MPFLRDGAPAIAGPPHESLVCNTISIFVSLFSWEKVAIAADWTDHHVEYVGYSDCGLGRLMKFTGEWTRPWRN